MSVLFVKQRSSVSEPPFGGLKGNVCDSSLARWKASGRLHIGHNWTFFAMSYGSRTMNEMRQNRPLLKGVGNFGAKY